MFLPLLWNALVVFGLSWWLDIFSFAMIFPWALQQKVAFISSVEGCPFLIYGGCVFVLRSRRKQIRKRDILIHTCVARQNAKVDWKTKHRPNRNKCLLRCISRKRLKQRSKSWKTAAQKLWIGCPLRRFLSEHAVSIRFVAIWCVCSFLAEWETRWGHAGTRGRRRQAFGQGPPSLLPDPDRRG